MAIEALEAAPATAGAWGGPLSTRIRLRGRAGDVRAWLAAQAQRQADRWTLWTPVAFGLGSGLYFALPREPQGWIAGLGLALVAALLAAARLWAPSRPLRILLVLAACALAGFSVAKLRSDHVKAPVAPARGPPARLQGFVVDVWSPGEGGQRLVIAPVRIEGWPAQATPVRVRITLREGAPIPPPGSAVSLLAMINAPSSPASPGAYDFARDAWFQSVGGVGFSLGPPQAWTADAAPPWRLRLTMKINAVRWDLTNRIVQTLGPETGGLAAAMTTGEEAFVPKAQQDNLRAAGLAHIVSISGVHMAIVGGFAFALARLLVAAWPWLALRVNGKKWAALFGLAAIGGYLVLSGAPAPAERSAITACVAFLAILFDRQAISLHSLALAAMAVLLLQPEAVTQPGFQMSFAATAALVALAEVWPRPVREINTPWPIRLVQGAGGWIAAGAAVSLVAGLATGPFAIQDFNRVSTWGLFANLANEPLESLLMMPGLAIGAVLTPLGLGAWPLKVAGFSIHLMNQIAAFAAAAPFAQFDVASGPLWALPVAFLGILWLCLWRGPLRFLGLPLALAVSLAPKPPVPDVWVGSDGAAVAVRAGKDALLFRPEVKLFGAELWARRRGLAPQETAGARDAAYDCDAWSCAPRPNAPFRVASAWNLKRPLKPGRLQQLCATAELVILRNDFPPDACNAPAVLTGEDFARGGSAELWRGRDGVWRVRWAAELRGRRPWTWGLDLRR